MNSTSFAPRTGIRRLAPFVLAVLAAGPLLLASLIASSHSVFLDFALFCLFFFGLLLPPSVLLAISPPGLSFDTDGLTVRTFRRKTRLAWSDFESVWVNIEFRGTPRPVLVGRLHEGTQEPRRLGTQTRLPIRERELHGYDDATIRIFPLHFLKTPYEEIEKTGARLAPQAWQEAAS